LKTKEDTQILSCNKMFKIFVSHFPREQSFTY